MDLSKDLYLSILENAHGRELEINGRKYTTKQVHPVLEPVPQTLRIHTLSGLIDYLENNRDGLQLTAYMAVVVSPVQIDLYGPIVGSFAQRVKMLTVEAEIPEHHFGTPVSCENFNIWLQSSFVDDGDRGRVLMFASNVIASAESGVVDNGVSQTVSVRVGITSKAMKELPNPVELYPFRTFGEIKQVPSLFIFRVHDGGPKFSLHEADGGAWRQETMRRIRDELTSQFEKKNIPVAVIA